ncbi:hypothetical protein [Desulfotruncus alcoholivorax]|uniref:hypothetical protein n=1 Tax=Desulfotruncus alcoholivorax TaxID=265477 RepID=UPI00040D2642|nr:hypothetical protein [Desulfotruncus alcoholivorax]
MNRVATIFAWIALTVGTVLAFWGLYHMTWPGSIPFDDGMALLRYLTFLLSSSILIAIGVKHSRKSSIVVGCVLCIGITILSGEFWALLVTVWFILASAVLGRIILSILNIDSCINGNWVYNFLIGAGFYGTVIGLIAHFPVNYPGLYGAALAVPLILEWRTCLKMITSIRSWFIENKPLENHMRLIEVAIIVVALIHFVVALMPELMYDALTTHLFIPAHLALRHQWGFNVSTYVWAVMPMLGDWIFSFVYMLAGETASRLINVSFIFVLGWLVRDLVLWAGGTALGARWAVLIFLSTPLTFTESSSLFIESIWASFVVASILYICRLTFREVDGGAALKIGSMMLGFAIAAKAITFTILPLLCLILVYRIRMLLSKPIIGSVIVGLSLLSLLGGIPYLTAWYLTSNPVFPFFNEIFKSPYYPLENFNNILYNSGMTWDLLYRITFYSNKYMEASKGASGFQWILLLVPVLILLLQLKNYRGILLFAIGVVSLYITFQFQSYLRYVFPQFTLLTALIGIVISSPLIQNKILVKGFTYIATFAVALNLLFLTSGTWAYRDFYLKPIFSDSNRKDYLAKRLPLRNAVDVVNALNTHKTPVAVFGEPLTAGLASDALYINWYNQSWQSAFSSVKTEQDLIRLFGKKQVEFFIIDSSKKLISDEQHVLLEQVSIKLAQFGSVAVYRLKDRYRFQEELLTEPNFTSTTGWSLVNGAIFDNDSKIIIVNVSSPATQRVAVIGGSHYLNTVVVRCHKERTQGRIQVNWIDANGKFIDTSIQVFECTSDWREHSMEVTAPLNAVSAEVYASGHTTTPLEFKSVSFKR